MSEVKSISLSQSCINNVDSMDPKLTLTEKNTGAQGSGGQEGGNQNNQINNSVPNINGDSTTDININSPPPGVNPSVEEYTNDDSGLLEKLALINGGAGLDIPRIDDNVTDDLAGGEGKGVIANGVPGGANGSSEGANGAKGGAGPGAVTVVENMDDTEDLGKGLTGGDGDLNE